ncbi:hypothetical protein C1646_757757 [Rhizophagus diaphanus]|nr:hypothetical protein C1646_757757 [Rhizophagus diaphanus] [Rhizophagus sp. MUCL 43196]
MTFGEVVCHNVKLGGNEDLILDEWINIIQKYYYFWKSRYNLQTLEYIDFTVVTLPTGIDSFEKLLNALKKDISFTVFKNTNKRKLQSLKYNPVMDASKFILTFRKLCYNAEIHDIEEQQKYLCFCRKPKTAKPDPNSLWTIHYTNNANVATYNDTSIELRHLKST